MSDLMPAPMLALKREVHRAHISLRDFEDAARFIEAAKRHDLASDEHEGLLLAALIHYARPFSRNEVDPNAAADVRLEIRGGVDAVLKTAGELTLHQRIINLRNKAVAHAESEFNPMKILPKPPRDPAAGVTYLMTSSRRWHAVQENIDLDEFGRIVEAMRAYCMERLPALGREIDRVSAQPHDLEREQT